MGEDAQTAQSFPDGVSGSTAGAPAHDPGAPAPTPDIPTQILRFVDHHPLFRDLDATERARVAASVVERLVAAHEVVLLEGGAPAEGLFLIKEGIVEVLHGEHVVDVLGRGELFGELTLVSGEPPAFTIRAHEDTTLFVVPRDVAVEVLTRPAGIAFMAAAYRDRLLRSASTVRSLPQAYTATVSALVEHEAPVCDPETTVREATTLMSKEATTAILVETRAGLGIVTNADLRDKVLLAGVPVDAPVERIMSMPVTTVPENALASDAAVLMMDAGVKHLGVVDARGRPVGVISADSFMTLGALSPLALRHALAAARDRDELVAIARRLPDVFLGLLDSRLEAPAISRVLTAEHDALVVRLIELAIDEQGAPPAAFSWLALGSAARGELTLSSDQDNGLAFDDPDSGDGAATAAHPMPADPDVEAYFARLAQSVNAGLVACGYEADYSGVTASNPMWRLSLSTWKRLFTECLVVPDHSHLIGASIAFDFRTVTGQLRVVPPLLEIVRTAPKYPDFLASLAQTVTDTQSPLGFRRRLTGPVDIKKSGLFPIENLARYYALGNGLTPSATLDRLTALEDLGTLDAGRLESLKAAYKAMADLRLRHHADLLRVGRRPDNAIDTTLLTRLEHAELQEALRVVDDARKLMPPRLHGWG